MKPYIFREEPKERREFIYKICTEEKDLTKINKTANNKFGRPLNLSEEKGCIKLIIKKDKKD